MSAATRLLELLCLHARTTPDAPALTFEGHTLTHAEVFERASAYATGLRAQGVERGERVAVILETSLELVVALLGHYMLGVVHVPVNTRYGDVEVAHILSDSGASAVLVDRADKLELVREHAHIKRVVVGELECEAGGDEALFTQLCARAGEVTWSARDEDVAMFIYTSGTTGASKGVVLTHAMILSGIDNLTRLWRWHEEDVLVLALPLFHVHGLCIGVHGTLLRGCHAVLQPRFEPGRVAQAIDEGGTIFMGVPTMYTRLVRAMEDDPALAASLSKAALFTSGSAALSAQVFERFEALTGHRILERYGMSETMLTVSNPYEPERRKPGTIGFAVPGCEVCVVDDELQQCAPGEVGQLVVRGESVTRGYWQNEAKTAESFRAGWFLTGDAARYDEQGYIVHVGRRSVDVLKSGGYKISAREIEEVLLRHPQVEEAAVVGIPDEEWGQRIGAALVVSQGARQDEAYWLAELEQFVAGKLADYKRPRQLVLLAELPRNALGKIQKHRLVF